MSALHLFGVYRDLSQTLSFPCGVACKPSQAVRTKSVGAGHALLAPLDQCVQNLYLGGASYQLLELLGVSAGRESVVDGYGHSGFE